MKDGEKYLRLMKVQEKIMTKVSGGALVSLSISYLGLHLGGFETIDTRQLELLILMLTVLQIVMMGTCMLIIQMISNIVLGRAYEESAGEIGEEDGKRKDLEKDRKDF